MFFFYFLKPGLIKLVIIFYFQQILGSYFNPLTNSVIILKPHCGTIKEPGLPLQAPVVQTLDSAVH